MIGFCLSLLPNLIHLPTIISLTFFVIFGVLSASSLVRFLFCFLFFLFSKTNKVGLFSKRGKILIFFFCGRVTIFSRKLQNNRVEWSQEPLHLQHTSSSYFIFSLSLLNQHKMKGVEVICPFSNTKKPKNKKKK